MSRFSRLKGYAPFRLGLVPVPPRSNFVGLMAVLLIAGCSGAEQTAMPIGYTANQQSAGAAPPTATPIVLTDEERVWCANNADAVLRASYLLGVRAVPDWPAAGTSQAYDADLKAGKVAEVIVWPGRGVIVVRTDKTRYGIDGQMSASLVQNMIVIAKPPNLSKIKIAVGVAAPITTADGDRVCHVAFGAR